MCTSADVQGILDAQIERVEVSLSREYVCLSAALMQRHQTEK